MCDIDEHVAKALASHVFYFLKNIHHRSRIRYLSKKNREF